MRHYPALTIRSDAAGQEFVDLVAAELDDFGLLAIDEVESGSVVRAFFADASSRDLALASAVRAFPEAAVEAVDVSDENWAERSQASLRAIRAGHLTIAPPWDVPEKAEGRTVIILPSTGFGTGHHATTRLCLAALQDTGVEGKVVLDVGTGSGVLAIASVMLGAKRALAIDYDQDAIDNAHENLELNAGVVERTRVQIVRASIEDETAVPAGQFDLVLANLTGAMLAKVAAALRNACASGGTLIVSGLREDEEAAVREALGLEVASQAAEDGWIALVFRKSKSTDQQINKSTNQPNRSLTLSNSD